jgi:hypothetical protein
MSTVNTAARLALRPYPSEPEECIEHRGRWLVLRPIRPEDGAQHRQFLSQISSQDLRMRFFSGVRELPESELAHFTLLVRKLIRYCRERGTHELWGSVLAENTAMLDLARSLGFRTRASEQNVAEVALDLQAPGAG